MGYYNQLINQDFIYIAPSLYLKCRALNLQIRIINEEKKSVRVDIATENIFTVCLQQRYERFLKNKKVLCKSLCKYNIVIVWYLFTTEIEAVIWWPQHLFNKLCYFNMNGLNQVPKITNTIER